MLSKKTSIFEVISPKAIPILSKKLVAQKSLLIMETKKSFPPFGKIVSKAANVKISLFGYQMTDQSWISLKLDTIELTFDQQIEKNSIIRRQLNAFIGKIVISKMTEKNLKLGKEEKKTKNSSQTQPKF